MSEISDNPTAAFFSDIAELLSASRHKAYQSVNAIMVETYWHIGRRIVAQEQSGRIRAGYGDHLITTLSQYLTGLFGKGFSEANLLSMRKFFSLYPDFSAFHRHCLRNLSWTNIRAIIRLEDEKERQYYLREASSENWSSRILERNIKSGYYRRLLSSQAAEPQLKTVRSNAAEPSDFIKDPYVLEFLDVPENLHGKESLLENALINNIQKFLLELGKGFSFVARQQRISTEIDHFYIDLVFYNYLLKCFVVIDLKTKPLSHADIGQMDMYVRMFDALKRGKDDNPSIGIILCADKADTMVKYSVLKDSRQIFASKYKTILPTEDELADMIARENKFFLTSEYKANKPDTKVAKGKNV